MSSIKLNWIFFLALSCLIFHGCNKDEEFEDILGDDIDNQSGQDISDVDIDELDNDIVKEWTNLMLKLERYANGMRPNASARAMAYIYLSAYETAVPGMRNNHSNKQRFEDLNISTRQLPDNLNFEIALNSCFANSLDHFLINVPTTFTNQIYELEESLSGEYERNSTEQVIEDSRAWGIYVSNKIIEFSQTDNAAEAQILKPQPLSYEPPVGPGFWTYSADEERALFPYWGEVRTFVIAPEETTTVAPIAYSSVPGSPYFEQMNEVYNLNYEAREENGEQLWIAEFWSDDVESLTFSPPARQFSIANQLIEDFDKNLEETLNLYVKLGFALNDAAVSTWKYKYQYMVMRPNVFIHKFIDQEFQTNLFRLVFWPNPSFPGYPSGHSCFASAAAGLFINEFGNQINFTDRSHEGRTEFKGEPRSYSSIREMAKENAFSRIPLGVHIRMDCAEGLRLGYEISDAVNNLILNSTPEL